MRIKVDIFFLFSYFIDKKNYTERRSILIFGQENTNSFLVSVLILSAQDVVQRFTLQLEKSRVQVPNLLMHNGSPTRGIVFSHFQKLHDSYLFSRGCN